MKNLIIIGARGWGREVLWSLSGRAKAGEFTIKGFLDSDLHALDGLIGEFPPILGSVEDYEVQPDDIFFCAMGNPIYRRKYAEIIEAKGGRFYTFVSKQAFVSPNATIGEGSFVAANTTISDNVVIGKQAMVHGLCTLGHDVKIGDYVSIEAYCFFGGYSSVGNNSSIHVRSTIIAHKSVGVNASVGAGSVVIRNVKDGVHVFGNPATKIN